MIMRQRLANLRQAANEYPSQFGMSVVVPMLVGSGVIDATSSILQGLAAFVFALLVCVALLPMGKRIG